MRTLVNSICHTQINLHTLISIKWKEECLLKTYSRNNVSHVEHEQSNTYPVKRVIIYGVVEALVKKIHE